MKTRFWMAAAIILCACGETANLAAPTRSAHGGKGNFDSLQFDSSTEYICGVTVSPSWQAVEAGQSANFSVTANICRRSDQAFLRTVSDWRSYWYAGSATYASVGTATNSSTHTVTATTTGVAGTTTITSQGNYPDYNFNEINVSATLVMSRVTNPNGGSGGISINSTGSYTWSATMPDCGTCSYQWYFRNSETGAATGLGTGTSQSFTVTSSTARYFDIYVVATNTNGHVTSAGSYWNANWTNPDLYNCGQPGYPDC